MEAVFINYLCLLIMLLSSVNCQRLYASIPGISTSTREGLCVAKNEIDNNLFNFKFLKSDGITFLQLTLKDYEAFIQAVGEDCWPEGSYISWHLHEKTAFGKYGVGDTECAPQLIGGHWDPTLACGPSSGNELCKVMRIPGSSVLGLNGSYQCSSELYKKKQYACEAGDLSGKYGKIKVPNFQKGPTNMIAFYAEDTHDTIHACELERKSLVLHCANSKKALCVTLNQKERVRGEVEAILMSASNGIKLYMNYFYSTLL